MSFVWHPYPEHRLSMNDVIYEQSSALVMAGLLVGALLTVEMGFRLGCRRTTLVPEAIAQANAVLVSMLSLLALLLAFTFSAALQRYDERSRAVVAESNAIGTTYLRTGLLPEHMHAEAQALLRKYLDARIREGQVDAINSDLQQALLDEAKLIEAQLWNLALTAAEEDQRVVVSGLFIETLNELIDTSATRSSVLNRHVPEVVLILMFATFMMTSMALGHAAGIAGHRPTPSSFVLLLLIVLVFYLIVDLDRSRRGAIQVSQESLTSLQQTIGSPQQAASDTPSQPFVR